MDGGGSAGKVGGVEEKLRKTGGKVKREGITIRIQLKMEMRIEMRREWWCEK